MKVKLYAVLDNASAVYDGPIACLTDAVALRNFCSLAQNTESPVGRNPECFSIWRVGEWDDALGKVVPEVKECLGYAIDLIQQGELNA